MFDGSVQGSESQNSEFKLEFQDELPSLSSTASCPSYPSQPKAPPSRAPSCSLANFQESGNHKQATSEKSGQAFDVTQIYLREIGQTPLPTAADEVYYARCALQGDARSKRRMIESNLRLVVKISRRYINRGMALLDLIEEGNLGLIHAVEKFDPERGFRFSTYATWWIRQGIERGLMNQARTIRLPVHVTKELNSVLRKAQQLATRKARDPSAEEIAAEVGKTVPEIKRLLRLSEKVTSADAPILADGEITLQDTFAADNDQGPDNLLQNSELRQRLGNWLHQLPDRHREILSRRFGLNGYDSDTLENVGSAIGLTRERVRQIQIEALKKLKSIISRMVLHGISLPCSIESVTGISGFPEDENTDYLKVSPSWIPVGSGPLTPVLASER